MSNRELFVEFYKNSENALDIDPGVYMSKYIVDRLELNSNQVLWFCFLNATTYQLPTSFLLINEYPDLELAGIDRLSEWWDVVQKRCPFQQDKLKQRKYLPETVASYQAMIGSTGEAAYFKELLQGTPEENFEVLWSNTYLPIRHFGRFSVWNWAQMIKHVAGYPMEPTTMMFGNKAESITHGMCHVLGWGELTWKKRYLDGRGRRKKDVHKFTKEQCELMENEALSLREELGCSFFELETVLCAFKKLFRERDSRYVGYYHDRMGLDIAKLETMDWIGVPWRILHEGRQECLNPKYINSGVDKSRFTQTLQEKII
jgi:hypothetical protein